METTCPCPARASSKRSWRNRSSASRPTNTVEPPLDLARAGQPVDGAGRRRERAARRQLEAPGEERRRLRADDHVSRIGVLGERLQQRAHRPLGVRVDGGPVAMAPDGQLGRVKRQDDGGAGGLLGSGTLGDLLDGHGRRRRVALRVLERLEPEGGDQAGRADLVHSAAEALHLVDDGRERTVRIRRRRLARSPHEPRPEKRDAAGLPAHARGSRRRSPASVARSAPAPAAPVVTRPLPAGEERPRRP